MGRRVFAPLGLCAGLAAMAVVGCDMWRATPEPERPMTFTAELEGQNVVPEPVETEASGEVRATISGRTLEVNGHFRGLSSELRDLEEEGLTNPGVHIHPGQPGETNPYLYGLSVELDEDERSGTFYGTFELSEGEVRQLYAGSLYVDIHTVEHEPGEVRDQLRPEGARITRADREAAEREARGEAQVAVCVCCEEG